MRTSTHLVLIGLTALILGLLTAPGALAQATATTTSKQVPYGEVLNLDCVPGGDLLVIAGFIHEVDSLTLAPGGNFFVRTEDNPQGLTATGSKSGDTYHITGVTRSNFNLAAGATHTIVNRFNVIGPGPGNNYLLQLTEHLTVNANGDITVFFDTQNSLRCQDGPKS